MMQIYVSYCIQLIGLNIVVGNESQGLDQPNKLKRALLIFFSWYT